MIAAVLGGVLGAVTQLLGFFVALLGTVTSLLLELAVQILNAVISTGLISLSYTNLTNPFIAVGWGLTRGLTNIIFVLALLAIGLGTALKINDYQAKKALPLLIAIALLINFTPVILGVIVDASNIIMNYFLGSGFQGGSVLVNQVSATWTTFMSGFGEFWNPAKSVNTLMSLLVINVFNIIAAFIFFIFAAIFLMRYVVIWLLVILSPIAFASYILPATRSIFKKWWTQFIQWTFVGVTAGFFLYLANQLMKLILIDKAIVFTAQEGAGLGLLNYILPWFVIIIFLILGLQTALSSSAQGASLATNFAKNAGKKIGGFAANRGKMFARENMPKGLREWGVNQAQTPTWGSGVKGVRGWAMRTAGTPAAVLRRGVGGFVGPTQTEARKGLFDNAEKNAVGKTFEENIKKFNSTASNDERAAILSGIIKNKDADKLTKAMDDGQVKKNNVLDAYSKAKDFGKHRIIEKSLLHMGSEFGLSDKEMGETIGKLESEDIPLISGKALEGDTLKAIVNNIRPEELPALMRRKERNEIWSEFQKIKPEELIQKGPDGARILRWSASSAAQGLGLSSIGGLKIEDINAIVTRVQKKPEEIREEIKQKESVRDTLRQEVTRSGGILTPEYAKRQGEIEKEIGGLKHMLEEKQKAATANPITEKPSSAFTRQEKQDLNRIIPGNQRGLVKERDALISEVAKFQRNTQAAAKILEQTTKAIKSLRETQSKTMGTSDLTRINNEVSVLEKNALEHTTALEKSKLSLEGLKTRLKAAEGSLDPYKEQVRLKKESQKTIEETKKQVKDLKKEIKK